MSGQLALGLSGLPEPHPTMPPRLPDAAARHTIQHDLDVNLFVEAGAGAGKTDRLVARVVSLCTTGVPLDEIAAITFTEKAAAELRHRVRDALTKAGRADLAAGVEQAAIGTLHAFARRILQEFPIEAGLPPAFAVLDEVGSDLAFSHRWAAFLDEVLATDERARLVVLSDADGIRVAALRQIAEAFGDNWDLVDERVDLERPAPVAIDVPGLLDRLDAFRSAVVPPPHDAFAGVVADVQGWILDLQQVAHDDPDGLDALTALQAIIARAKNPGRVGNKTKWKAHGGDTALTEAREALGELGDLARAQRERLRAERRLLIGAELGRFTLDAARQRRRLGELEFHDLLVLARSVVAAHHDVRGRLHRRYTRLLLDEFQDTDPIQLELAVLITADPDDPATEWTKRRPLPGRLFVVGDPKQSIYRFRRADIGQYLTARDELPATVLTLSANFRTVEPLLQWVNDVFGRLIVGEHGIQPVYVPLDAVRAGTAGHAGVTVVGPEKHEDGPGADELRRREAADIAQAVRTAVVDGWVVGKNEPRPCRWGDVAILLPARTSLPILEDALTAAGVPYRTENSSLVYAADEVRALLLALRAIDDPADELALVTTLRSALYGCSDVDLYEWRERGGRWSLTAPRPARRPDDPVADAFDSLATLTAAKHWTTPAELIETLVEERRVLEVALAAANTRDQWRRVRFLVDQARAWSEAGGAGIRGFVSWTARQAQEGRYVADVVLPEQDHDAVRILTIHAAKGLEFPIVALSGMSTRPGGERGVSVTWPPGTWDLKLGGDRAGPIYEDFKPLDEQMSHAERLRLLYVACTRAEDHLIVSLHREFRNLGDRDRWTSAELLADASRDARSQRVLVPSSSALPEIPPQPSELAWMDTGEWETERARVFALADRPGAVGASRLHAVVPPAHVVEPGLRKDPVDLDLPPWQRGRYGTAIGRAVHAVLQAADLRAGSDIAALAATQAGAEGVMSRAGVVERLARSALAAPTVRLAAAGAPHWRELYVAATFAGLVVEGYIDLLVRTPDGLVVVDYKTDATPDPTTLEARVAAYTDQLAAYGLLVEAVMGEPVVAGCLVFCREDAADDDPGREPIAREVIVPSWAAALAALRERLAAGGAAPTVAPPATPR